MSATVKQPHAKLDAIQELQALQLQASFTVGVEGGNVINVAVAIKDGYNNVALAVRTSLMVYLADAATGAAIIGTAPSGGIAAGTNGAVLGALVANKLLAVVTNAAGLIDFNITEAGVKTLYVVVVLPDGRLAISGAVTFA